MANNRKKVVLTIKQKLKLIEQFERGESTSKLSREYGIGTQTVRDIVKQKRKLEEFSRDCISKAAMNRKTMKVPTYEDLDSVMLKWFNEKRAEGVSVSGPMCIEQAKLFHDAMALKGNFKASYAWLTKFKQRYGIGKLHEERLGGNVEPANRFPFEFE